MRKFMRHETYCLKGIKRSKFIKDRWTVVNDSLARVEDFYTSKFPAAELSFCEWLKKPGLRLWKSNKCYKEVYMDALLAPILEFHDYFKVNGEPVYNLSEDAYYGEKIRKGLIIPRTAAQLKKRRSRYLVNWEDTVLQPKWKTGEQETDFTQWIDSKILGDGLNYNQRTYSVNPEKLFLMKQDKKWVHGRLTMAGFTPSEIEIIFQYLDLKAELDGKRGAKKAICEQLKITRDKLNWLLKRLDNAIEILQEECGDEWSVNHADSR